jgi:hypothetical protein
VQAKANTDALAKQAALHVVVMLKGEVVNQFTIDHLGSTASSVSSSTAAWRIVGLYFHEHGKLKPGNFESDRNDLSLSKRWIFIQAECNHFCGVLKAVKKRKLSGHGVAELVRCFLCVLISLCEVGILWPDNKLWP